MCLAMLLLMSKGEIENNFQGWREVSLEIGVQRQTKYSMQIKKKNETFLVRWL
jgi:hypothetical protein